MVSQHRSRKFYHFTTYPIMTSRLFIVQAFNFFSISYRLVSYITNVFLLTGKFDLYTFCLKFSVSFSPIVAKCSLKTLTSNEAVFTLFFTTKMFLSIKNSGRVLLPRYQVIIVPSFTHPYSLNSIVPT